MAVQRFIGHRYSSLSTDPRPSIGVEEGATLVTTDDGRIYYYSGGWRDSIANVVYSGYTGSGFSGFVNVRKNYIVTNAPTGRRIPITLPNNGFVSGSADNFFVFVEGMMQQQDSVSGAYDNDFTIVNSGNATTPGQIAFSYAIPSNLMITFKYLYIFFILSVILL